MEEVMAERRKKLSCFQKTHGGVVKKGDTIKASTPVNAPFTLEEFVHMIDVSVSSKYGADLEAITRMLTDSVKGSVESLRLEFKQEAKKMPRQVRSMVQQVLGEVRDKREFESPSSSSVSPNLGATMAQGVPPSTIVLGGKGAVAN
jgi:uncharacterized protein YicC (UPF0701 family)